ncbi:MAG: hypothetical protein COB15_16475 [Flavobacteriales bacterium]|nr:MAG: hypothetical protein COB15_16475 [Flavobacteriales bacterium]
MITKKSIYKGKNSFIHDIKILLYKENENIFDVLDFEDDNIYLEPLLYVYFAGEKLDETNLDTILYGYIKPAKRPKQISVKSDNFGRIYLPNLGWIHTENKECYFVIISDLVSANGFFLVAHGEQVNLNFEPLELIKGTAIELIKYPIPALNQFYFNPEKERVIVEIEHISKIKLQQLTKSWNLIERLVPDHFQLIISAITKNVVFNIDAVHRNSFASERSNGLVFFNAYQKEYNEVFFIDDIAHQTGHAILYSVMYNLADFFIIDPTTALESLKLSNGENELRDARVLLHSLYTYYTVIICLDACLDANIFKNEKRHEILARIYFYLSKCRHDLSVIENNEFWRKNKLFTEKGKSIYNVIKEQYCKTFDKWMPAIQDFDMSNQPYNFTYSKFVELNPLKEEVC